MVYHCGTPTWRPQNNVIIFNLLWVSRRLFNCTEETGIYTSTFPNNLTSKMAKYHKIRICFFDERVHSSLSRTATTLKFKLRWFPDEAAYSAEKVYTDILYFQKNKNTNKYTDINLPPLMSNGDKNIIGSLILDLR